MYNNFIFQKQGLLLELYISPPLPPKNSLNTF